MNFWDHPVFCVVCGKEVPSDRKKRRSVTCSEEHQKIRTNYLRERKELKKCKYCNQPSTPEEREEFKLWRRDRKKHPHLVAELTHALQLAVTQLEKMGSDGLASGAYEVLKKVAK